MLNLLYNHCRVLRVKKNENRQHLSKLWAIKYWVVFNETLCTLQVQHMLLYTYNSSIVTPGCQLLLYFLYF